MISTTYGRQFIFTLKSVGSVNADSTPGVDLFVNCRPAGLYFIEETFPTALGLRDVESGQHSDFRLRS